MSEFEHPRNSLPPPPPATACYSEIETRLAPRDYPRPVGQPNQVLSREPPSAGRAARMDFDGNQPGRIDRCGFNPISDLFSAKGSPISASIDAAGQTPRAPLAPASPLQTLALLTKPRRFDPSVILRARSPGPFPQLFLSEMRRAGGGS